MDLEQIRNFALSNEQVTESSTFGVNLPQFKVGGKIFMIMNINFPYTLNLKCDPERAISLREEYEEIQPGYHMNKVHWNTILLDGRLTDTLIKELITHSYELIKISLPKKSQELFNNNKRNEF